MKYELTLEILSWKIEPNAIEITLWIKELNLNRQYRYSTEMKRWGWYNYITQVWESCYDAAPLLKTLVMKNETLAPFLDKMLPAVIAADS